MMRSSFTAAALGLLLFSSCGSGGRIDPDRLDYEPEFGSDGTALVMIEEMPIVINRDYEPLTPLCNSIEEIAGGYIVASPADGSRDRLYDASFNVIDSAIRYISGVSPSGIILREDVDDCVSARDIRTGRDVFAEKGVSVIDVTECGTVVLRRLGAHQEPLMLTGSLRPVYDYMIVNAEGVVKAPWGRYRYIESFSNGRAKFTNGAFYCQWRTGHFAEDDFSDAHCDWNLRKFGYIDEEGRVAIPERFDMCDAFDDEGHARALENWGDGKPNLIIDKQGNTVGRYRARNSALY